MIEVNLLVEKGKQQWELGLERLYTRFKYEGLHVGVKKEEFITVRNNGDIFRNNHIDERISVSGLYLDMVAELRNMFYIDHVKLGLSVDVGGNIRKDDKIILSREEQGIEDLVPIGYRGRFGFSWENSPIYGVGYFAGTATVKIMLNREFPEENLLGTFTPTTVSQIREEYDNIRETLTLAEMAENPQLVVQLDEADNAFATPERSQELGIHNISIISPRINYEPLDVNEMVEFFMERIINKWGDVQLGNDLYIRDIDFEVDYLSTLEELEELYSHLKDIDPDEVDNLGLLKIMTINNHTKEEKSFYVSKNVIIRYMENDSPESLLLDVFNQFLNTYGVRTQLSYTKENKITSVDLT